MQNLFRTISLVLLFFMLVGCAGRDFVRPSADAFQLGRTSYSQVVEQMGDPESVEDFLKNGNALKGINYVYASTGGSLEEGVIPARSLAYYFHKDILVGQAFNSSFRSDHSDFDITKIESIKKGKSTRLEVIQLFGKPTVLLISPMVKETSGEVIGYRYSTVSKKMFHGFKTYVKSLDISFDNKDIVSEVEYVTSGNKE